MEADSRVAMSGNLWFIKEGKHITLQNKDANYTLIGTFVDIITQIGEEILSHRILSGPETSFHNVCHY